MSDKILEIVELLFGYIDAIPSEAAEAFPGMPGFDRDWAEEVIKDFGKRQESMHSVCKEFLKTKAHFAEDEKDADYREACHIAEEFMKTHEAPKAPCWVSLASAPKDGEEILGWGPECGVVQVRYTAPKDFLTTSELGEVPADEREKYGWFAADFVKGGRLVGSGCPVLWMPMVRYEVENEHLEGSDIDPEGMAILVRAVEEDAMKQAQA